MNAFCGGGGGGGWVGVGDRITSIMSLQLLINSVWKKM